MSVEKKTRTETGARAVTSSTVAPAKQSTRHSRDGVVQDLWDWDTIAMFHAPVSEDIAPGYSAIVTHPIDLTTIKQKNASGAYDTSDAAFVEDLQRMVSNALQFNDRGTMWHSHAKSLQKKLRGFLGRHGIASEDDEVYLPTRRAEDSDATLLQEEKRAGGEDVGSTLEAMKQDMAMSVEELRAKYSGAAAKAAAQAFEEKLGEEPANDEPEGDMASDVGDDDAEEESSSSGGSAFEDSGSSDEEDDEEDDDAGNDDN
jgi:hypothetical protein